VHAQGTEFALLQAELAGQGAARVLDLGCGAGHVSFHVAPLVKEVVAYDLSQQMLDVVAAAAVIAAWPTSPRSMAPPNACRLPMANSISCSAAIRRTIGATSAWPCAKCVGC
jgi:SAM-dependent methyltransferase